MPMFSGFRFMERFGGSSKLDSDQTKAEGHRILPRFGPLVGNDLRPACLTLFDGVVTVEVLQWWRRLDLAKDREL
jgi:hypothetical protein